MFGAKRVLVIATDRCSHVRGLSFQKGIILVQIHISRFAKLTSPETANLGIFPGFPTDVRTARGAAPLFVGFTLRKVRARVGAVFYLTRCALM